MLVDAAELANALDKSEIMREHYSAYVLNGNAYPRSVQDLLDIVRDYIEKDLYTYSLKGIRKGNSIRGVFVAKDDCYEIYLAGEPTLCKNRFVLCKEIFHVLLDEEPYRNMDIYGHLKEVMIAWPAARSVPSEPVVAEQMAECAAMEFLFPYSERLKQIEYYRDKPEVDSLEIANYYKVPQYLVEIYLSDNFMETFGAFHSEVSVESA